VTRPFSLPYKERIVQQLVGTDAKSARQVAKETGIAQETVSRWLREARSLPLMPPTRKSRGWSLDEKIRILAEASKLTGDQLRHFLEREGLLMAELEQWRLALDSGETSSKATTKAIRGLERELARKEKALAEAAALLVLKKKVQHLWEDEDDGTDERNDS
jgi:transposase